MPYSSVYIDLLYLASAIGIWLFLMFNVVLTIFAFLPRPEQREGAREAVV